MQNLSTRMNNEGSSASKMITNTRSYLTAIEGKNHLLPRLDRNNPNKLLHMKEPLGDWNEWAVLTYDHNVLGSLLAREKELLQKKIKEYERKLERLTCMYPGLPFAPRSDPGPHN